MKIDNINMAYFIGAGGIGMSALARYLNSLGKRVAGYDLTRTPLTDKLIEEGIDISFIDDVTIIPPEFLNKCCRESVLVIYTPAIPDNNRIVQYFKNNNYNIVKRSKLLGALVNGKKGIAVAGTHGKTSVSAITAHLLRQSSPGCTAFLGGVMKNYSSNILVSEGSEFIVAEADEYDRSFLQLRPYLAVITSIDPDHLDVYGNFDEMKRAFFDFARQVKAGGTIIYKYGLDIKESLENDVTFLTYGMDNRADYSVRNVRIFPDGLPVFDVVTPGENFYDLKLGVPGRFNVENAVAAIAAAMISGATRGEIKTALASFQGIYRRFDVRINNPDCVLIDDYAHHPAELRACISAVRQIFPGRKITGVFQPHLYSRTRDFAVEFAESLDALDNLVLLDIYPAREKPIPGVLSELIFNRVKLKNKFLCQRGNLPDVIAGMQTDVVIILGAGNIDAMVEPVKDVLINKIKEGR